jgi:hypothetical protein
VTRLQTLTGPEIVEEHRATQYTVDKFNLDAVAEYLDDPDDAVVCIEADFQGRPDDRQGDMRLRCAGVMRVRSGDGLESSVSGLDSLADAARWCDAAQPQ